MSQVASSASSTPTQLLSLLNITLNCHYCWAQFQLNVTKNFKSTLHKNENGKYMQHLAQHLNAPYKCNECSYPIVDTKTFLKHKLFYKHDEKTCIMVDNDIQHASQSSTSASGPSGAGNSTTRRKTLIATRLKQHHQNMAAAAAAASSSTSSALTSNEMQLMHDRDSFKCSLCYADMDPSPSTTVSTLNRSPTNSSMGASNFSFDKEQVLKHVLIVHLSFLAYKCDACVQFYAFDEPQTKQHAALVHHCGGGESAKRDAAAATTPTTTPNESSVVAAAATSNASCHFKLIKTEEEINLAINRAQQFIAKIQAASPQSIAKSRQQQLAVSQSSCVSSSAASVTNLRYLL